MPKNNTTPQITTNTDYAYAFVQERHRSSMIVATSINNLKDVAGLFNTLILLSENPMRDVDLQTIASISRTGKALCDRRSDAFMLQEKTSQHELYKLIQKSIFG